MPVRNPSGAAGQPSISADIDAQIEMRDAERSVLTAFGKRYFIEHAAWRRLTGILEKGGGGSYGLSGPRGSGKTWMMFRASAWAEDRGGLGIHFPSQSDYDPVAFMASITENLALSFDNWYDRHTGRPTRLVRQRITRLAAAGAFLLYLALVALNINGTFFSNIEWLDIRSNGIFVALLPAGVAVWLFVRATQLRRESRGALGRVRAQSEEMRIQVRYVTSLKESSEAGADAGLWGVAARFKRASARELVERPSTLSGLVHNFRNFAYAVGEAVGDLVICIDELDKMSDASDVAELLRYIKGIFEIPGVCFMVSLSEEAARSLDLGSIKVRNEFSSSFNQVIPLAVFSSTAAVEMIRRRDSQVDPEVARTSCVMSGGVPRETVRNVELADSSGATTGADTAAAIALMEIDAFKQDLFTTRSDEKALPSLEQDKLTVHELMPDMFEDREEMMCHLAAIMTGGLTHWNLTGASQQWRDQFEEQWQRLLVRLAVAGALMRKSVLGPRELSRLQSIIGSAFQSALVARSKFVEYSSGQDRDTPDSVPTH
ncbi:hypothetical protein AB0D10_11905 [Kitasatospora sp. NPDC048545]|uniref:hypothetical protein n=1 Tax=Kitasatospora sp. NPDC048545 TaxID=3157208 RepID=UPI0033D9610C